MTIEDIEVSTTAQTEEHHEDGFHEFATEFSARATQLIDAHLSIDANPCLVKIDGVYEAYLNGFDESVRQQYVCRTCEAFLNTIGSWAIITNDFKLLPFVLTTGDNEWVPELFKQPYKKHGRFI
jgi:hypothetical protein